MSARWDDGRLLVLGAIGAVAGAAVVRGLAGSSVRLGPLFPAPTMQPVRDPKTGWRNLQTAAMEPFSTFRDPLRRPGFVASADRRPQSERTWLEGWLKGASKGVEVRIPAGYAGSDSDVQIYRRLYDADPDLYPDRLWWFDEDGNPAGEEFLAKNLDAWRPPVKAGSSVRLGPLFPAPATPADGPGPEDWRDLRDLSMEEFSTVKGPHPSRYGRHVTSRVWLEGWLRGAAEGVSVRTLTDEDNVRIFHRRHDRNREDDPALYFFEDNGTLGPADEAWLAEHLHGWRRPLAKKGSRSRRSEQEAAQAKVAIVARARQIRDQKYGNCPVSGACLWHAVALIEAAASRGRHLVLQAGSAGWRRVPPALDDGVSPNFFSYMWEPDSPKTRQILQQIGRGDLRMLPEMHVWVGDPKTQEIIDITSRYFPEQAKALTGMDWLDVPPPDFLWVKTNDLPANAYYEPSGDATILAGRLAMHGGWRP